MTVALIIRCDGTPAIRPTIPLGQCRAAYPARSLEPVAALTEAHERGWSSPGDKDLCPSCSRYV